MKFRTIPGTLCKVSEVGFSLDVLARRFQGEEKKARYLAAYALDRGINFFEASEGEDGWSERILGAALRSERERIVLSTKFEWIPASSGSPPRKTGGLRGKSPFAKALRAGCEKSLKRLGTDHIDLYQIHHPSMQAVEQEDLCETMERLRREGKIGSWGAALGPGPGWLEEGKFLLQFRKARALAVVYHPLEQEPGRELVREAKRAGAGIFARVPCFSVFIRESPFEPEARRRRRGREKIERLQFLVLENDRTLAQAAVQFALSESSVICALPDIESEAQINEFVLIGECAPLTADELRRVETLYENHFNLEELPALD